MKRRGCTRGQHLQRPVSGWLDSPHREAASVRPPRGGSERGVDKVQATWKLCAALGPCFQPLKVLDDAGPVVVGRMQSHLCTLHISAW